MSPIKKALLSAIVVLFSIFSIDADAKNADLSRWLKNLSESALATEPGHFDFAPEIITSGNTVHVVWISRKADWSGYQVYYRRSLDKGVTWQPKILITEIVGNDLVTNENYRRMAVDGNNVHIFIARYRGSWYGVLTYFRSINNGASFEAERDIITAENAHHIYDVYAHASKGKVVVGYIKKRNWEVVDNINVLVSNDNGVNFVNNIVTTFHKDNGDQSPTLFDMQVDGEKIYLVYGDSYSYYGLRWARLFFSSSLDSGANFVTNRIDVPSNENNNPKSMANNDYHYVPKIAFAGNRVYVVFNGVDFDGKSSIFLRRSIDSGATFKEAINLSKTELPTKEIQWGHVTLAARGAKVYVVFTTTDGKIYLKRSMNSGSSFYPIQELTAPEASDYPYGGIYAGGNWRPVIKLDPSDTTGSKVHVVGSLFRYVYSNNSGESFTAPVRLDVPFASSDLDCSQMAIGTDGKVHLVAKGKTTWYSTGVFGDSDIFYRVFYPDVPIASPIGNKALALMHKSNAGDGTGDERWDTMQIASSPELEFTSAVTIEAWIKVNRVVNGEAYFIVKTDPGADGSWVSYMLGQWRDGKVDARIATTAGGYVLVGGDPIPNNKWTHVAMTYDTNGGTNNFKVYVDGKIVGQTTVTGTLRTNRKGPILIGGGESYGENYSSLIIDEIRFWNRALTQDEIQINMRRSLNGGESGLIAYYNFNEPINRYGTIRDITGNGNKGILSYKEQLVTGVEFALKILKPNGGELIPAGINYTILWQAPSKAVKFKLYYSTDNKISWNYIAEVGNVREYLWTVPAQDGRKPLSFIKLEAFDSTNNKIGEDVSDKAFVIEVLKLIQPNGGETLTVGQTYQIKWQTYSLTKTVAKVQLQYSTNGGSTWSNLKTFVGTNPGQYNWTVPNTPSTNCKVRVILKDSTGTEIARDASDRVFTISQ